MFERINKSVENRKRRRGESETSDSHSNSDASSADIVDEIIKALKVVWSKKGMKQMMKGILPALFTRDWQKAYF